MSQVERTTEPADGPSILVAEDHEPLRECLRHVLARNGYRVFTGCDGVEALEVARSLDHFDALVSDLEMPRMRGDELAARFHTLHPAARIVFISSSSPPRGVGAPFEFLAKPFKFEALLETLQHALAA